MINRLRKEKLIYGPCLICEIPHLYCVVQVLYNKSSIAGQEYCLPPKVYCKDCMLITESLMKVLN